MLSSLYITLSISVFVFLLCFALQLSFYRETRKYSNLFCNFFYTEEDYQIVQKEIDGIEIPQLKLVGEKDSDLNKLLQEINHYIVKTKGTTDFAVIQNKVERMLNMRYEQAEAKLSFPTHLGLMGTFLGVLIGISMFISGFDGQGDVRDDSIRNLLIGVLVSMSTSLIGLFLTTWNTASLSESRKEVEEDKNAFYDFIQTELMPSLDVSLVVAISKLHDTVDKFEPAFDGVINRFQLTFDRCTKAFGDNFEKNVNTVSNAVEVMGDNMDKINKNIELQEKVLSTFKSDEVVNGLEKYVVAANSFVNITQSLNKFEEARRMMLAAAQEAIEIQNTYSESLKIPREIAVRINNILDRIKTFEDNINRIGDKLNERDILGNDVVNAIRDQVNGIEKKSKIADRYLEVADGKLEDLFQVQTKAIEDLNKRYRTAISEHADEFEILIEKLKGDIEKRHNEFLALMEENLNVEMIHKDFSNLSKLDQLSKIKEDVNSIFDYLESTNKLLSSIEYYQKLQDNSGDSHKKKEIQSYIPINDEEVKRLRKDNQQLKNYVDELKNQLEEMKQELKRKQEIPSIIRRPISVNPDPSGSSRPKPDTHISTPLTKNVEEKVRTSTEPHDNNKSNGSNVGIIGANNDKNEENKIIEEKKEKGILRWLSIFNKK